ncbi:hypothetical protein DL93DRAFT_806923 [Clavulina sp. PMI_390]|nr:hypothetical protein DL93DRAFT_806923 [Clavulina sp. PMI_390]
MWILTRHHHPPMRSCMRRSSLSPSRTGNKEVSADLKNDNSADTSDAAPNMHILPPLVEDSNFLSQLTGLELPSFPTAPSSDPSSSPPPPSAYKRSREKSASMSGVQSSTSTASMAATCSSSGATAAPASSSPLSRTLSPVSYFARRRGASLSSTLPSTSSATPSLSFASATAESSSEVTSLASTSTFFHHHHKEEAAATVPLAPCCPQCIRTLSSHPSSLLPIDSERDAHWTRGAWAKKQADELEEKAIRDSAAISNGNAGAADPQPSSSCTDRLWTAPEHHDDDDAGLDVVSAAKRTPLSPASIKRNRELRLSLDLSSLGTELLKVPNDGESPGLDTDVADLGVQALKAHSRLGRRNSSDDLPTPHTHLQRHQLLPLLPSLPCPRPPLQHHSPHRHPPSSGS